MSLPTPFNSKQSPLAMSTRTAPSGVSRDITPGRLFRVSSRVTTPKRLVELSVRGHQGRAVVEATEDAGLGEGERPLGSLDGLPAEAAAPVHLCLDAGRRDAGLLREEERAR